MTRSWPSPPSTGATRTCTGLTRSTRGSASPSLISAWPGINSAASWAPDGRTVALTLSYQGNPEIYSFRLGTANFKRLTNHRGIDTDATWSPTGREIAFTSDRNGAAQVWVMDAEGANPRRLTTGGYDTQPKWSPRGDTHPLHPARRRGIRHLGDLAGRRERAPAHQRTGREQERVVGPERPPHRLRVVAWRTGAALHDADGRIRAATPHPRPWRGAEPHVVATASVNTRTARGRKERGMNRRRWQTSLMVVLLFGASVLLAGCPKKPAPAAGTAPGARPRRGGLTGGGTRRPRQHGSRRRGR